LSSPRASSRPPIRRFRADFEPLAKEVLVVKSPGPALADPAEFRWTRLRKGVRLRPLGPVHV
jgi:microcystin degradation protein MlrC